MFSLTKPSLVFCEENNLLTLKKAIERLKLNIVIYVFGKPADRDTKSVDELLVPSVDDEYYTPPLLGDCTKQVALIHCSSGTTGLPKAVCLSHAAFLTQYGLV